MKSRVCLRRPSSADRHEFVAAARRSRTLHRPWASPPRSAPEFRAWLGRMRRPGNQAYLLCRCDTDALAGVVAITNILLGRFCSGCLEYYVFTGHERRGLTRDGLRLVMREAFGPLGLHRLEANIQPGNAASLALVKSCGFSREGFSPRYLKIGGRWRDHERWALLRE